MAVATTEEISMGHMTQPPALIISYTEPVPLPV